MQLRCSPPSTQHAHKCTTSHVAALLRILSREAAYTLAYTLRTLSRTLSRTLCVSVTGCSPSLAHQVAVSNPLRDVCGVRALLPLLSQRYMIQSRRPPKHGL